MIYFLLLFVTLLLLTTLPLVNFSFFAFPFEVSKFVVFLFLGSILTFLLGLYSFKQKVLEFPAGKISFSLAIFFLSFLISTTFSLTPMISLTGYFGFFTGGFIYLFLLLIIFYSAFILGKEKILVLKIIFFSGAIVAAYGLWQYLHHFLKVSEYIYRIYSTIGQPNRLAFFLLSVFPLGFFIFLIEKKRLIKIIYGIFLTAIFTALLLTFSRTSFAILVAIIFLMLRYSYKKNIRIPKGVIIVLSFGILVFGMIFARSLLSTFNNYQNSSLALRLAEWEGSAKAIIDRDLIRQFIGYGPETSYFVFFKYRPVIYNESKEETAVGPGQIRNHYLNLLSTLGLLGFLAYFFFILKILRIAYRKSKDDLITAGVFFSLLSIFLLSFFYYQTEVVSVIFWVLSGITIASSGNNFLKLPNMPVKNFLGLFFMSGGLVLFYLSGRIALAHYYASLPATERNFQKAIDYNPWFDVYRRNLSKLYMYEMLQSKDRRSNESLNKYARAKGLAKEALDLVPIDIRNIRQFFLVNYYAGVYLDKRYQKENVEVAERLVNLSPSDPLSWDLLGLVYLDLSRLEEAKRAFEKEKDLSPNSVGVYLHLGEVTKQQGKIEEAIKLYKTALRLSPSSNLAKQELEKAQELLLQK